MATIETKKNFQETFQMRKNIFRASVTDNLCIQTKPLMKHRIQTYFTRGSITVGLTSYLTGLDLTKQVNLLFHKQT